MSKVVDYAFSPHPSISTLEGGHIVAVGRYVSESISNDKNGKNLIPSENAALKKAGIAVVLFAEEGATDMLGGKSAGIQRAQHFKAVINASSINRPNAVMVCTADFDATPAQQTAINAYLEGAISVLNKDQVALYGGYYPVSRALNAGVVKNAVQTFAWSRFSAAHVAGQGFNAAPGNEVFFNLNGNPYTLDTQEDQQPTHNTAGIVTTEGIAEMASALPAHAVLVSSVSGRALPGTFLYDNRAGLRQGLIGRLDGASVDFDESVLPFFCQDPAPKAPADTYREWMTKGGSSLNDVALAVKQPVGTILRQTAIHYGRFDTPIADYLDGLANGNIKPTDAIAPDGRLWVRTS